MKVRIEMEETLEEEEVVIRCREWNERVQKIQQVISQEVFSLKSMVVKKEETEYYLPIERILFFETSENDIYAHTSDDLFKTGHRLYELEELLPGGFLRVSKSTIINVNHVYSITKNLAASSAVQFHDTHKQVFVSRHYYKVLANRLNEKWSRGR